MYQITFLPNYIICQAEQGENLLAVAIRNSVFIEQSCLGNRTCGKCKLIVLQGNDHKWTKEEQRVLSRKEQESDVRLACCVQIYQDMTIQLIHEHQTNQNPIEAVSQMNMYPCAGDNSNQFGIALDIGTTTIVGSIFDMSNTRKINTATRNNPQVRYGADVISRIFYAIQSLENEQGIEQALFQGCYQVCMELLRPVLSKELWKQAFFEQKLPEQVAYIVCSGNTVLTHMLLGKSLQGLAKTPISLEISNVTLLEHTSIGSKSWIPNSNCMVTVLPPIAGFVGGDLYAGYVALTLGERELLLDIGTNGEIIGKKDDVLYVCSTAAGPAFEGSSLSQGMRAEPGAITKGTFYQNHWSLHVLGDDEPIGICASGYISILSELKKHHLIDETGQIISHYIELPETNGNIDHDQEQTKSQRAIVLYERKHKICITQQDIRQFQLAKASIRAGLETLFYKTGSDLCDWKTVYLGGAFSNSLDVEAAVYTGLLPEGIASKVVLAGNTSLAGAEKILLDERTEQTLQLPHVCHIELAKEKIFSQQYISHMDF